MRNASLGSALEREVYAQPALVAASPWLGRATPPRPSLAVSVISEGVTLRWNPGGGSSAWLWVLQTRRGQEWSCRILPGPRTSVELQAPPPEAVALSAVDRFGNASSPVVLERKSRSSGP